MDETVFGKGIVLDAADQLFFVELGKRVATRRKERGFTQARLGEILGFSQPHIQAFESGRRRIPASLLPKLAECLGLSVEALVGTDHKQRGRGRPSKLEEQFTRVARLPRKQQQYVSQVLDAVLLQVQA